MKNYFIVVAILVLADIATCQECKCTPKCDDNKSTSNNSLQITCSLGSSQTIQEYKQKIRASLRALKQKALEIQREVKKIKINPKPEKYDVVLPANCQGSSRNGPQTLRSGEKVFCYKGWTVFQRRYNGTVVFHNKTWNEYKDGFGGLDTEFWMGLTKMRKLTRNRSCKLRIELGSFDGGQAYAEYRTFSIGSESNSFRLSFSGFTGTAGDTLRYTYSDTHNNMPFTTVDRDNDQSYLNCAASGRGGWWHKSCGYARLNGKYGKNIDSSSSFTWYSWKQWTTLKSSMMMARCR